jgi:hypothetical protein
MERQIGLTLLLPFRSCRKVAPIIAQEINSAVYAAHGGSVRTLTGAADLEVGGLLVREGDVLYPISVADRRTGGYDRTSIADADGWASWVSQAVREAAQVKHAFQLGGKQGEKNDYVVLFQSGGDPWIGKRLEIDTTYEFRV